MELILQRYSDNGDDTLGLLYINGEFFCYTLEDEHRDVKKAGETRIPCGFYSVGWMEHDTPLTKYYRSRYHWFDKHIEVKGVKDFTGVYFHVGNTDKDTAGCVLLGDGANNNTLHKGRIHPSTTAFKRFYHKLKPFIDEGEVNLEIRNEAV